MIQRNGRARLGVRSWWRLLTAACGVGLTVPVLSVTGPVDAAVGCSVSRPLAQGSTGADVNCLEVRLRGLGHQSSYVDSYFGTVTTAAVKRFQTSVSLPASGVADQATLSALGLWSSPGPVSCKITTTPLAKETSTAVACVESRLRELGLQSTYIDSYYGTVTAATVKRYQSSVGIIGDGSRVDAYTAISLGIWGGPPPPPPPADPVGCLQYGTTADADRVFVINPSQYVRQVATSEPGVKGPIIVIGDSLTWQTAKDTAVQLRAAGWGPVCVQGTIAASVQFGNAQIPDGLDMIARIRATHPSWVGAHIKVVVALGTNDVGFSTTSLTAAKSYVTNMLAAIGPTTQPVAWMTVRTERGSPWPAREDTFNRAVTESGVQVMPWSAEFSTAYCGTDDVHLVAAGRAARVALYGRL